jgi:hypothetical protein
MAHACAIGGSRVGSVAGSFMCFQSRDSWGGVSAGTGCWADDDRFGCARWPGEGVGAEFRGGRPRGYRGQVTLGAEVRVGHEWDRPKGDRMGPCGTSCPGMGNLVRGAFHGGFVWRGYRRCTPELRSPNSRRGRNGDPGHWGGRSRLLGQFWMRHGRSRNDRCSRQQG